MTSSVSKSTQKWHISGMDCASCTHKIQSALAGVPGLDDIEISIMNERLQLRLDESQTQAEQIEAIVRGLGYSITPMHETSGLEQWLQPMVSQ